MKLFQNCPRLKLWLHAIAVLAALYWLVDWGGYKIIIMPLVLMLGAAACGTVPAELRKVGTFGVILSAVLILVLAWSIILLFVKLLKDKTTGMAFKLVFASGLLIMFAGIFCKQWPEVSDRLTSDAIFNAIYAGDIDAYEKAVKWRKSGDINDDLWSAARDGQLRMVQHLMAKGANPNARLGGGGDSVLSGAIPNVMDRPDGNKPVIEYLTSHGATN